MELEPEFDEHEDDVEADWWHDAAMANDGPVLTVVSDVALVLVVVGEQALKFEADTRAGRRISVEGYGLPVRPVPAAPVLLAALALTETVRRITTVDPMPLELAARLDQAQNLLHVGEHVGEAAALLADDAEARAVAAIRPPSPIVMQPPSTLYACSAVATRPPEDCGTLPAEIADEFDRALADSTGREWAELRDRAHAALEACARDRTWREAGNMMHTLRSLRVRRCWLDQPGREALVPAGEPGTY